MEITTKIFSQEAELSSPLPVSRASSDQCLVDRNHRLAAANQPTQENVLNVSHGLIKRGILLTAGPAHTEGGRVSEVPQLLTSYLQ